MKVDVSQEGHGSYRLRYTDECTNYWSEPSVSFDTLCEWTPVIQHTRHSQKMKRSKKTSTDQNFDGSIAIKRNSNSNRQKKLGDNSIKQRSLKEYYTGRKIFEFRSLLLTYYGESYNFSM